MDAQDNPYSVKPGDVFLDRKGRELVVDLLEFRRTARAPKGQWVASCVREGTGIRVHPALTSFDGTKNKFRRKVTGASA